MRIVLVAAALAAAISMLSGCTGVVLENASNEKIAQGNFDGAVLSYFLAKGETTITASYAKGELNLAADPVKGVPDFNYQYNILYRHAGLATDVVHVQYEGGLLKLVSSSPKDQTIEAIAGVNAVLEQLGSLRTKLTAAATATGGEKESTPGLEMFEKPPPIAPKAPYCDEEIRVIRRLDVTYQRPDSPQNTIISTKCDLVLTITATFENKGIGVAAYPTEKDLAGDIECSQAICFRLAGVFKITARATLVTRTTPRMSINSIERQYEVLAPTAERLGFVRFNRRAFVNNTTSIGFADGMLNDFQSTDPSELVGFLNLPSTVLGSIVLALPLGN